MTSFINKFVNIKYYYKRPKEIRDKYLFNFFVQDFLDIKDFRVFRKLFYSVVRG